MENTKIQRINELARLAKERELTQEELNERDTLRKEYMRDLAAGVDIQLPKHYFPNDDPNKKPPVRWRSCAHLLYANWLNYCVYQTAPYDIRDIEKGIRTDD